MRFLAWMPLLITLSGCGQTDSLPQFGASQPTQDGTSGADGVSQSYLSSCESGDLERQCIGLKVVSFKNPSGIPVLNEGETLRLISGMNEVWKSCNINFQLEKYEAIEPESFGLPFSPDWKKDSDSIRERFDEKNRFLIVAVGPWSNATIAVAQMPGNGPFGVLVSEKYAKNAYTVGHELGHYQGLYHLRNKKNLMNSYIGPFTSGLNATQCAIARRTNLKHWQKMLRIPSVAL